MVPAGCPKSHRNFKLPSNRCTVWISKINKFVDTCPRKCGGYITLDGRFLPPGGVVSKLTVKHPVKTRTCSLEGTNSLTIRNVLRIFEVAKRSWLSSANAWGSLPLELSLSGVVFR